MSVISERVEQLKLRQWQRMINPPIVTSEVIRQEIAQIRKVLELPRLTKARKRRIIQALDTIEVLQ